MIVSVCTAHAFGIDVIGHHVSIVGESYVAQWALGFLLLNLTVHQLPHFRWRSQLAITSRMMGIFNPLYSGADSPPLVGKGFSTAAGQ